MEERKWTAAQTHPDQGCGEVYDSRGLIARCTGHPDVRRANATLMAAAPDLLAALERVTTPHWNDEDGCDCGAFRNCIPKDCRWAQARAAIAKARGA